MIRVRECLKLPRRDWCPFAEQSGIAPRLGGNAGEDFLLNREKLFNFRGGAAHVAVVDDLVVAFSKSPAIYIILITVSIFSAIIVGKIYLILPGKGRDHLMLHVSSGIDDGDG